MNIFNVVQNRVSTDYFNFLNANFTAQDVQEAIRNLKANSAPGLDGLSALFYQKYWDIIGGEIIEYILNILNNERSTHLINHSFISLIPKINSPTTPSDFRLISLCNVILKIITKSIANGIKQILPKITKEFQSAFVPGRLITENSLIDFETLHYIRKRRTKNNGYVGIKLDVAKSYDSLEWDFIENTMTAMGFPNNLIKVIMLCLNLLLSPSLLMVNPLAPLLLLEE